MDVMTPGTPIVRVFKQIVFCSHHVPRTRVVERAAVSLRVVGGRALPRRLRGANANATSALNPVVQLFLRSDVDDIKPHRGSSFYSQSPAFPAVLKCN